MPSGISAACKPSTPHETPLSPTSPAVDPLRRAGSRGLAATRRHLAVGSAARVSHRQKEARRPLTPKLSLDPPPARGDSPGGPAPYAAVRMWQTARDHLVISPPMPEPFGQPAGGSRTGRGLPLNSLTSSRTRRSFPRVSYFPEASCIPRRRGQGLRGPALTRTGHPAPVVNRCTVDVRGGDASDVHPKLGGMSCQPRLVAGERAAGRASSMSLDFGTWSHNRETFDHRGPDPAGMPPSLLGRVRGTGRPTGLSSRDVRVRIPYALHRVRWSSGTDTGFSRRRHGFDPRAHCKVVTAGREPVLDRRGTSSWRASPQYPEGRASGEQGEGPGQDRRSRERQYVTACTCRLVIASPTR